MKTLPLDLDRDRLPRHIACIMDGNGRWAEQRGLPRVAGHRQGARVLKDLVRCCKDWGIPILTVYAFSTENWQRPLAEVSFLMRLFEKLLDQELAELHREGVKLQFLGDLTALPAGLQKRMLSTLTTTSRNTALTFNVAVNYGSRAEITRACRHLAQQVQRGLLAPGDIDERMIEQHLDTGLLPPPDLLIRTSGECRLSNYLLWQLAYAELYFTPTPWPEFDRPAFHRALQVYQQRDRRFGALAASLSA